MNDLRHAVPRCRSQRVELLPSRDNVDVTVKHFDTLREHGARYVRAVLDQCNGNKGRACRVLNITYHTLRAYLRLPTSRPSPFGPRTGRAPYPSIYRRLVRAAAHECAVGHANALHEYVKLARALVPARGVFGPLTRDEGSVGSHTQEIGERWFGVTTAHQRLLHVITMAMPNAECASDKVEDVHTALGDYQRRSDTAHFYAGLAFGLVFVEYGMVLSALPPSLDLANIQFLPKTDDAIDAAGRHTDLPAAPRMPRGEPATSDV